MNGREAVGNPASGTRVDAAFDDVPDGVLDGVLALSFDLDDTLWDCAPAIRGAEEALYRWFERETPRITARNDRSALAASRVEIVARHPQHASDVTTLRRVVIRQWLREHDYPDALVEPAFETFLRARSDVVLYAGVPEMLARLGERYRLAAITNGNANLVRIGLAHHFEVVLAASATVAPKPSPEMFHSCIEQLDIDMHQLLHIGDNIATDVGGARGAGARALWFNPRGEALPTEQAAPHASVDSIEALVALLAPED